MLRGLTVKVIETWRAHVFALRARSVEPLGASVLLAAPATVGTVFGKRAAGQS